MNQNNSLEIEPEEFSTWYYRGLSFMSLLHYEKAIFSFEKSLEINCNYQPAWRNWSIAQYNLGNFFLRQISENSKKDIELAIAAYLSALQVSTEEDFPQDWAMINNNLAIAYTERIAGDEEQNIELAIQYFHYASKFITEKDTPEKWAIIQKYLAEVYTKRIAGNREDNLELAIYSYNNALKICTKINSSQQWAAIQSNLGDVYSERIVYSKRNNLDLAIKSYEAALTIRTSSSNPAGCVRTARNLGNLYLNEGQWKEAVDAYNSAIEAVEQLREWAIDNKRKQEILSNAVEVYIKIVEAYINLGQIDKAIEYVERGKARNLVDLLATRDLYPKGDISQEVIDHLGYLRQAAIAEERRLNQQRDRGNDFGDFSMGDNRGLDNTVGENEALNRDRLNNIRQELENLFRDEIQEKDPSFQLTQKVEPISFKKIQAALPNKQTVLIEWFIGDGNFSAFIVTRQQESPVYFDYTEEQFQAVVDLVNQYLGSYLERDRSWQTVLPDLLIQLAEKLQLEVIVEQIKLLVPNCDRLILVPHRWLHLLPIHALPLSDGKCLLDLFHQGVSYAPSVQLLELTQKQNKPQLTNLFAVENPTEDKKLKFTKVEVTAIRSQFNPNDDVLIGKKGHKKALTKERLGRANCTHFSCHGTFNFERPELSALLLANSLVEETGEQSAAEEGDKTRFLAKRDGGSIALNQAQLWLRDLTKEELAEWKTTLDIGWQMYKVDQLLIDMPDNSRPFASPYHWAAFCAVGS